MFSLCTGEGNAHPITSRKLTSQLREVLLDEVLEDSSSLHCLRDVLLAKGNCPADDSDQLVSWQTHSKVTESLFPGPVQQLGLVAVLKYGIFWDDLTHPLPLRLS